MRRRSCLQAVSGTEIFEEIRGATAAGLMEQRRSGFVSSTLLFVENVDERADSTARV